MTLELTPEPWIAAALCAQVDTALFFPDEGRASPDAKRVCLSRPVRDACLQYALDHHIREGIWGGLSERERRKIQTTVPFERPKRRRVA